MDNTTTKMNGIAKKSVNIHPPFNFKSGAVFNDPITIVYETLGTLNAKKNNASVRICEACKVYGSHAHPEGFVAFLDNDAAGTEIEFMQVYSEEELKKYNITGI